MEQQIITHGSLFSGIGGFDLAADWMGWKNLFHCEWNEFGQKVLKHYWPEAESFNDITKTDFKKYANKIDILTGGFPCQPYSMAGKRLGKEDDRHLWPEMLRAIREIKPRFIVGENVSGIISWNGGLVFEEVQVDLENEGYEVQAVILPAVSVNAPHRRDRVWFVAYSNECATRSSGESGEAKSNRRKNNDEPSSRRKQTKQHIGCRYVSRNDTNTNGKRWKERIKLHKSSKKVKPNRNGTKNDVRNTTSSISTWGYITRQRKGKPSGYNISRYEKRDASNIKRIGSPRKEHGKKRPRLNTQKDSSNRWKDFPTESPILSGNDGISDRLDGITFPKWRNESIKAAGNAIVPQVAFEIFKALRVF